MSTRQIRVCYCAGLTAGLLLTYYNYLSDASWGELPWEFALLLTPVLLVCLIEGYLPYFLVDTPAKTVRRLQITLVAIWLYLAIPHYYMSLKLADLHREFRAVAGRGPQPLPYQTEGDLIEYSTTEFGFNGALDHIVRERDERLATYHCRQVQSGWFWDHRKGAVFQSFYLWTPWQ
jgi:hypothetical protein